MATPATAPQQPEPAQPSPLDPDRPLSPRGWIAIGACILAANVAIIHYLLRSPPEVTVQGDTFHDDFDRAALGDNYWANGGPWAIRGGQVFAPGVLPGAYYGPKNDPLWLKMRLPRDGAVSFTVSAASASAADIRFVAWGDGRTQPTGYLFVMGGSRNTVSSISRGEEFDPVRVERRDVKVQAGRRYQMRIERIGGEIRWLVDGQLFLELKDPRPLEGKWHDRFGFSSEDGDLLYDDLDVKPLGAFSSTAAMPERVDPLIQGNYVDFFERGALGADWLDTSANAYQPGGGVLTVRGAHNHPLWLRRRIPRDAMIELDATARMPEGDIKVEAWGDGQSFATQAEYTATSYVFIFGGWHNTRSEIARMDEHGQDVVARSDMKVEPGRKYHFTISRKGSRVEWRIDGQPFLAYDDPHPLEGPGHDHFGFNDWEAEVAFDNLAISPAP